MKKEGMAEEVGAMICYKLLIIKKIFRCGLCVPTIVPPLGIGPYAII